MNADLTLPGTSPFDAIALPGERWSARALMPLLGYGADWRNFVAAVDRAKAAATNQGFDAADLFVGVTENSGGRPREDFHLTRFACYLVAMNGDPRKSEVAAAQAYFAIKTREAESARRIAIPADYPSALEEAAKQARRAIAAEAKVAELEPKAEVAAKLLDADGDLSVRDTAQTLTRAGVKTGQQRLFTELARRRWVSRAGDGRWRVIQYAIDHGFMSVIPQSHYHPKSGELVLDPPQPRVTPKGLQRLLADLTRGDAA